MGLLSACGLPMSENVQVEELLRAPRLPGDYGALQNALNEWLGESAQLKYPMQGELLSPFLLQDLDGDGQQDAAVLYTTAQSSNVCIAFLQKDAAGVWQVRQSIEGLADTVDNVRLAQLQDGAATQLVVGYLAAQGDSYLAVYSYENGTVHAILEQSYEQYLVEDITGGGNEDLILMSTLEDGGVQIELTQVEFQIMELFFHNPGIALVREKILKGVWGENYFGDVKIVDVNIRRLRMKVEDEPSHPTHIMTVWGYGYRWEE